MRLSKDLIYFCLNYKLLPVDPENKTKYENVILSYGLDSDGRLVDTLKSFGFENIEIGPIVNQVDANDSVQQETDQSNCEFFLQHSIGLRRKLCDGPTNPLLLNIQPSENLAQTLPELSLEDVTVTYKKLLGKFERACIDLTPMEDEIKKILLEPKLKFEKFLDQIHDEKISEIGHRVAANHQINLLQKLPEENRRLSQIQAPLIRGVSYTKDISSLHLLHDQYFRVDRNFSDAVLKNILGGISKGQINGIVINANSYEESKLMIDRVNKLNKGSKIGDLKIDLNCNFDGFAEYQALKELNIQKLQLPAKAVYEKGPYLLKRE